MSGDERDRAGEHLDNSASARADRLRERTRRWVRSKTNTSEEGPSDPAALDDLVAKLDRDNPEDRAAAAWELAELASDHPERSWQLPVETKLAPLLADDDPWVRRGASWAVATVASDHPGRARSAVPALTESLGDEDPLVRENGVLAVSDVASEYPHAVEPALGRLAQVARNHDGLTRQYAAETLHRLVRELDEGGFPETIAATPELADLLPGDADVVAVSEDSAGGQPIGVGGTGGGDDEEAQAAVGREDDEKADARGPPERISAPPTVEADRADLTYLDDLGGDPLTTAAKARASTENDDSQGVVLSVRTLRSDLAVDPDAVSTAFRLWAGADDHDHVLPVLARGETPRPWLATELADGGTLRDHIGDIGFDRALWYAHCVTAAMCHAHARGVIHGALRPGAVGLSRSFGAWPVPKVGDWGFGDVVSEVRNPPVPAGFAAPEHVAPEEFGRPDPATDIYQLGALCYALFAGRPPFEGAADTVVRRVRTEEPPVPSEFAADLPASVDNLLDRALTKEKRARFETVEDFRRELEVIAEEHGPTDRWRP